MEPQSQANLIRSLYGDVTWYAKCRYQYGMHNSYIEGCYWTTHNALRSIMIFGDVWDYYCNNGTGD